MAQQNSPLPVVTNSDLWPVYAMGMGVAPKAREKAAPTGEPTFSSQTILMSGEKDGRDRPDKAASVHVIKPAEVYEVGTKYVSRGRVYVQPYTPDGGRSTLSITVDELVPVDSSTLSSKPAGETK